MDYKYFKKREFKAKLTGKVPDFGLVTYEDRRSFQRLLLSEGYIFGSSELKSDQTTQLFTPRDLSYIPVHKTFSFSTVHIKDVVYEEGWKWLWIT